MNGPGNGYVQRPSGLFVPEWSKTSGGVYAPESYHAEIEAEEKARASGQFVIGVDPAAPGPDRWVTWLFEGQRETLSRLMNDTKYSPPIGKPQGAW
jgi:hypothetical protein